MIPGYSQLPIEFQFIFWLLIIFVTSLFTLVVFWTKRYIDSQDDRIKKHESRMGQIISDLGEVSKELKQISISTKIDFNEFRKEISQSQETIRKDTHEIRKDILVSLKSMDEVREKSVGLVVIMNQESKRLSETVGRVQVIEQNQTKIVTIIQRLSEKLLKVGQKKGS